MAFEMDYGHFKSGSRNISNREQKKVLRHLLHIEGGRSRAAETRYKAARKIYETIVKEPHYSGRPYYEALVRCYKVLQIVYKDAPYLS